MKQSKIQHHPDFGAWKPVKLTHRERLEIFRKIQAGTPTGEFAGIIPFPQLESIYKEFAPGEPKERWNGKPRGIIGDYWYCEAACGTVMQTKPRGFAFKARDRGIRYLCKSCMEKVEKARKEQK